MAGGTYRPSVATGNGRRARRPSATRATDATAPSRRATPPPPRRNTLDARTIDWWRGLPPRVRGGYRGVAICTASLLVFAALLSRQDYSSPLSLAGAVGYELFGWAAYPLFLLLALLGMVRLGESVMGRVVLRAALPWLVFALWCVALGGSYLFLGHETGGLAALLLSWPLRALLPSPLAVAVALALAVLPLLAMLRITPAHLARACGGIAHAAGRGIHRGAGTIQGRWGRRVERDQSPPPALADDYADLKSAVVARVEAPRWDVQASARGNTAPLPQAKSARPPVALSLDGDNEDDALEDGREVAPAGFANALEPPREWTLPPLDLLDAPQAVAEDGEEHIEELAERLERVLRSFRVEAEVRREDICVGPTVIRFGIRPVERARRDDHGKLILDAEGRPVMVRTRVSRIMNLRSDLALALEAHSLRMEAPVPGQPYVGLEIPRPRTRMVTLREILTSEEFQKLARKSKLAVALGRDVSGQARAAELTAFPHVLVAGATGAGKSVCLNAFLCSLLSRATPEDVRLLLVDPKKVELTVYNGIPHLLAPVITEAKAVPGLLRRALEEMERRYQLFSELGVRNLEGYRHLARQEPELERLPSIVIVIDELADLMMAAPEEVEYMICRLAQLARATGLHLVVATQRPSVDVITGLIKANIPTRVAFMVSSQVDSRTILDMGGAEHLLGRGDLLFLSANASKPERIQGAFVGDEEVGRLVRFWRGQARQQARPQPAPASLALDDEDDDEVPPIPPLPAREEIAGPWSVRRPLAAAPEAEEEDWAVVEGDWTHPAFDDGQTESEGWTDQQEGTRIVPTVEELGPWLRASSPPHHDTQASEER